MRIVDTTPEMDQKQESQSLGSDSKAVSGEADSGKDSSSQEMSGAGTQHFSPDPLRNTDRYRLVTPYNLRF